MKRVLLLYPKMLFYKVQIFNKLEAYLYNQGYELIIWATSIEDKKNELKFKRIPDNYPLTLSNYKKILSIHKIDIVINILFKSDPGYVFYFSSIFYAKLKGIPVIFYGHGINKQKDNILSNTIYNLIYPLFSGIILYSPNEKNNLWKIYWHKITIAYNTLDIDNRRSLVTQSKKEIKHKYGIKEDIVILSTGRMQPRKKLEILAEIFINNINDFKNVAWVIVGPELSDDIKSKIKDKLNIYYLGPLYDDKYLAEIFSISDIYSIPGALGLGILEAVYWGLPVITLNVNHGPELFYLSDNINGFIVNDSLDYFQKLNQLIKDDDLRDKFSLNAKEIYNKYGKLENMFSGFLFQLNRFN